jgi:hypothetical protein
VWINGMPYQLTSSGDAWAPQVVGGSVQWLTTQNGGVASQSTPLPAVASIAAFVKRVFHILSYGQSLSTGTGTTPVNTSPHCANRLLTLQMGLLPATRLQLLPKVRLPH